MDDIIKAIESGKSTIDRKVENFAMKEKKKEEE